MELKKHEVTAEDLKGPLGKFYELVSDSYTGQYWLHQLVLLMRKEATHTLTQTWKEQLFDEFTWRQAREHFIKTKKLWFNEPEWPFQLAVIRTGIDKLKPCVTKDSMIIRSAADLIKEKNKRDICLVRIPASFLGFNQKSTIEIMSKPYPELRLSPCQPSTPLYVRSYTEKYYGNKKTIFMMDYQPNNMLDGDTHRFFFLKNDNGYDHDIKLGCWNLRPSMYNLEPSTWLIFEFDQNFNFDD